MREKARDILFLQRITDFSPTGSAREKKLNYAYVLKNGVNRYFFHYCGVLTPLNQWGKNL
jgi:hypothetical protein